MREMATTVERLCDLSKRAYSNPHTRIAWPDALPDDAWTMSPELLSLYDTPTWARLGDAQRRKLAFFETVNFFSLNIHGERALVEGLARRLYAKETTAVSPYLHHFLDEENQHMTFFGTFCMKYAGKIYPEKKLAFARPFQPGEEDFLFFAKVMIFEELVDAYNVLQARDERLVFVAQQINLLHHLDETRHLAFGRLVVRDLWERFSGEWKPETVANLRSYLDFYLKATWREYYNPDVYRDAGIPDPYGVHAEALSSPHAAGLRRKLQDKCVRYLRDVGIFTNSEPTT